MCRFGRSGRLAAVWLTSVALATSGLTGCTREVSGSPLESEALFSVDFDTVLLDADDVDDVLGAGGSKLLSEGDAPDDTLDVDPSECHGIVYIAGEIEYASTDFTGMQWRVVGAASVGSVVEMVAELPSVAKADDFIDEQTNAWDGCADEVITSKDKSSDSTSQERVTDVTAHTDTVIASTVPLSSGTSLPCQHVLQAVSNVILDVSVCREGISDEAEAIASMLADRVQSG